MSILESLRVRASQGTQFIDDLRKASPTGFRGLPVIQPNASPESEAAARDACPTAAITLDPLRLDLGKCVFCAECTLAAPEAISFSNDPRMSATTREGLIVSAERKTPTPIETSAALHEAFGRSLRLRQVSAGGCNGCELELNAVANVNFDLQRYGIEWVASPRHADALVLTGPLTKNMADAVRLAWDAMPDPRFVVAFGACTISGGLYQDAPAIDRSFLSDVTPTLFVPGCPPHPLTFVAAIMDLLGIR
jgi:Ni,Fe-hydrogenase III small subunit